MKAFGFSLAAVFSLGAVLFAQVRTTVSAGSPTSAVGIPSGYSILGDTDVSPPGYTLAGCITTGGSWVRRQAPPTPRYSGVAAAAGGKVYVAAGYGESGLTTSVEEFDPATSTWLVKAPLPTARGQATAASVQGKVYVIGGYASGVSFATVEVYDPLTDTWSSGSPLPTARYYLGAAVVADRIYVIGGYTSTGATNAVHAYDPVTDTWETKASLAQPRAAGVVVAVGSEIYVISGQGDSGYVTTTEVYHALTDSWSFASPRPAVGSTLGGVEIEGKVWVLDTYSQVTDFYDPATDEWSDGPILPIRFDLSAAVTSGSSIHVLGRHNPSADHFELPPPRTFFVHRKN